MKIDNYNCEGLCFQETCNKKYTQFYKIDVEEFKFIVLFCKKHGDEYFIAYNKKLHKDEMIKINCVYCGSKKCLCLAMILESGNVLNAQKEKLKRNQNDFSIK